MPTVIRGSQHRLVAIKEVTPGTTPATPVMIELPIVDFSKKTSENTLRSAQIRSHPYVDRMLQGIATHELNLGFELQPAVHDMLFETIFGGTITAKALKFADVLKTLTVESQATGATGLFDHFLGVYLNRLSISASASDSAPIKCTASGMALTGTLDDAATIASSVTAATSPDPYVFCDATLSVAAVTTPVVSGQLNFERKVDPLQLWGSRTARENVPGEVTVNGTLVLPFDDLTQSTILEAFTDAALVFTFNANGAATFRKFTLPKAKLLDLTRTINTRAGIMQEFSWEAYYDTASTTICTMTTE